MCTTKISVIVLCFAAFLFSAPAFANDGNSNNAHFTIYRHDDSSASFFEIDADDTYAGVIKRSATALRTTYELSVGDDLLAVGVTRIASLGLLFSWATEIDVYDSNSNWIGMIDGHLMSEAVAQFSIYDEDSTLVGTAILDQDHRGYAITNPDDEAHPIARSNRHPRADRSDQWKVAVFDTEKIDNRILRIFAAMACDVQEDIE